MSEAGIDFENLPSLKNTTEMHFGLRGKTVRGGERGREEERKRERR